MWDWAEGRRSSAVSRQGPQPWSCTQDPPAPASGLWQIKNRLVARWSSPNARTPQASWDLRSAGWGVGLGKLCGCRQLALRACSVLPTAASAPEGSALGLSGLCSALWLEGSSSPAAEGFERGVSQSQDPRSRRPLPPRAPSPPSGACRCHRPQQGQGGHSRRPPHRLPGVALDWAGWQWSSCG